MRAAPCSFLICALVLALPGCTLFNKKGGGTAPVPPGGGTPPAKFPTTDPLLSSTSASPPGQSLIAGRVLDEFGRPASNSFIQLVAVTEKEGVKPVDVAADANGYFIIQGLTPKVDYKLIARTKSGERLIAGQVQTQAPNPTLVIKMRGDLAGTTVPEIPPHVGDVRPPKVSFGKPEMEPAWKPGSGEPAKTTPTASAEPIIPAVTVPTPGGSKPLPSPVADAGTTWPPPVEIKAPGIKAPPFKPEVRPTPVAPKTVPLGGAGPGPGSPQGPARVPSCVLVGKQLINFALNDINGEPWEFKTNRKGKLILLDFWGTWCPHCVPGLSLLRDLDHKYGSQGLEVIGVAYETTGTPEEQAYRVNAKVQARGATYRQLLASGNKCPVLSQFNIRNFPTMVLVDENGWILWRKEGVPSGPDLAELERWIQRRLPKGR